MSVSRWILTVWTVLLAATGTALAGRTAYSDSVALGGPSDPVLQFNTAASGAPTTYSVDTSHGELTGTVVSDLDFFEATIKHDLSGDRAKVRQEIAYDQSWYEVTVEHFGRGRLVVLIQDPGGTPTHAVIEDTLTDCAELQTSLIFNAAYEVHNTVLAADEMGAAWTVAGSPPTRFLDLVFESATTFTRNQSAACEPDPGNSATVEMCVDKPSRGECSTCCVDTYELLDQLCSNIPWVPGLSPGCDVLLNLQVVGCHEDCCNSFCELEPDCLFDTGSGLQCY